MVDILGSKKLQYPNAENLKQQYPNASLAMYTHMSCMYRNTSQVV